MLRVLRSGIDSAFEFMFMLLRNCRIIDISIQGSEVAMVRNVMEPIGTPDLLWMMLLGIAEYLLFVLGFSPCTSGLASL